MNQNIKAQNTFDTAVKDKLSFNILC